MGLIQLDYHYRRRHLDGYTAINRMTGPALAQRDDANVLVVDYIWPGPQFISPIVGRRGGTTSTIRRYPQHAGRLWLWTDRPMRVMQQIDAAGETTVYRADFATPLWRDGASCYQTDLYLDLFAGPSGDYAILDEDELEIARAKGLIDAEAQTLILAQLDELTELLEANRFGEWLAAICPAPVDPASLSPTLNWHNLEFAPGELDGWPQPPGDGE